MHLKVLGGARIGGPNRFFPAIDDDDFAVKVADTILAEECTRQRWEAALRKAKLRAKPWDVPTVMSKDLFW
jgi:hypothetical protein